MDTYLSISSEGIPHSLIPRPFPPPVLHLLQYANMEGEGLEDLVTCGHQVDSV